MDQEDGQRVVNAAAEVREASHSWKPSKRNVNFLQAS